jgi:hypothetical protein
METFMSDETKPQRPSLRDFDAYADRNGQNFGQDNPHDLARPAELQDALARDPSWQAETARLASGHARIDSIEGGSIATSEATEAETPAENLRRISDPSLPKGAGSATGQSKTDMAAASAPGERQPGEDLEARQQQLLDEAVEETFPASDPISPKRITR